jgi:hypothetical protein
MNIKIDSAEENYFRVEDVVSYTNIKIYHINDNKAPIKIVIAKYCVWLFIISLLLGLFFL